MIAWTGRKGGTIETGVYRQIGSTCRTESTGRTGRTVKIGRSGQTDGRD
jgi:hypothetical protein